MLVGVLADTHDNMPMIRKAVAFFAQQEVERILHAGDFVAPFALKALLEAGIPLIGVFGNNDGEKEGLSKLCPAICEPPRRFELARRTIVLTHDAARLSEDVAEGADVIISAHTHAPEITDGRPLRLNPGETGGWLEGRCTVALLDLARLEAHLVDLDT